MSTHRIRFLELGRWDWAPGFEVFWMEPNAPDGELSLVAMVIEGEHGTVMVNTGPDPAMLPELNEAWTAFDPRHQLRIHDGQDLDTALGSIGLAPTESTTSSSPVPALRHREPAPFRAGDARPLSDRMDQLPRSPAQGPPA